MVVGGLQSLFFPLVRGLDEIGVKLKLADAMER